MMANYYLAANDGTYAYRIEYHSEGTNYAIDAVHAAGTGTLPSGDPVAFVDMEVPATNVVIDQVLNRVTASNVAAYRTASKAQIDASW